jgi:hypothetical protein
MIPERLKSIWHDPVWSKVIAQGILGAISVLFAATGWLLYRTEMAVPLSGCRLYWWE